MSRAVLFDTETTGLDPRGGDRIIEIAALELLNDLPTGRRLHLLVDPQRDIPDEATRVHGITRSHLQGKPLFGDVAPQVIAFFEDSPLVAHNAPFDFGFLNAELSRAGLPVLGPSRMIDTLAMAKTRFPGLPNSLDALCRRFGIDLSERTTHNALLDCRLLANVYVELTGGRQRGLSLAAAATTTQIQVYQAVGSRTLRPIVPTGGELAAHANLVARLKAAIWLDVTRPVEDLVGR
jgi:DNA polymerase-3 subunit epsilon